MTDLRKIERKIQFLFYTSIVARVVCVGLGLLWIMQQDWSHGLEGVLMKIWRGQP